MRASPFTANPAGLIAGVLLIPAALPAQAPLCVQHELQKVIASDAREDDRFGASVSMSGNRAVVGAWRADGGGVGSGAAYVFRREDDCIPSGPVDDCWVEEDKLVPSDAASGDLFGWSVSISGDYIVVGARFHAVKSRSGAAYVFRRDDNDTPLDLSDDFWTQEDMLIPGDADRSDDVGFSVSIDGDRAIVAAPKDDDACKDNVNCDSGSAYVFRHDDNGTPLDPRDDFWFEEAKLTASDAAIGDNFAFSVSLSGDRAIVGAWHDDDAGQDSGSAYIFRYDDNATPSDPSDDFWTEEDKLIATDGAPFDNAGISVSISGDRGVFGAWLDDDDGRDSGSAYVFRHHDNGTPSDPSDDFWVEEDKLTAADAAAGDEFGKSVSIDGDRIAIGAFEDDDACAGDVEPDPNCDSGSAYVFRRTDHGTPSDPSDDFWVQTGKLIASDTDAGDFFGRVATSGGRVITGSLNDDAGTFAGAAYVYTAARACGSLVDVARFQNCFSGDGGSTFTDIEAGLVGVFLSSVSWGDFDGDEDLDLALAGWTGSDRVTRIYRNDGGTFTDINAGLTGVRYCSLSWGDYDNDGDLDLVLAGDSGTNYLSRIYRNNGGGTFTDIGAGLTGIGYAALAWGDYDNDGDLDLVLAGYTGSDYVSQIYRNDNGSFTDIGADLTGVYLSSVSWGDYDNDEDLDLALAGYTGSAPAAKIYRNDGNATFIDIVAGLTGVSGSSLSWGDYDNDGFLDLVVSGNTGAGPETKIYRNRNGSFTDIGVDVPGVFLSSVSWGDYDNDEDLDLALAGDAGSGFVAKIYRNRHGATFTDIGAGLTGVSGSSLAWGDYDNDGNLDLVLSGHNGSTPETKIYHNGGGYARPGCRVFDLDDDGDVDLRDHSQFLRTFTGP